AVAHLHANAIDPLAKRLRAATSEKLFYLERRASRNVVSRQAFGGPLRGKRPRIALENGDFTIEPLIRRLRDLMNAAGISGVRDSCARTSAPRQKSFDRVLERRTRLWSNVGATNFDNRLERNFELDSSIRTRRGRSTKRLIGD